MLEAQKPSLWLRVFGALVVLILVAPVLVVIPIAFAGDATFRFPPVGLSTQWFDNLFTSEVWRNAIRTSLAIAIQVVVLSVLIGTACALALDRGFRRLRGGLFAVVLAPQIVPVVLSGIGVYALMIKLHLLGTNWGFVIAHTSLAIPFVVIPVMTSLSGVDRRLESAAATLGAGPLVLFTRVTLPMIAPGVVAGAAFAFLTSFDEVVTSLLLASPLTSTVPVEMFKTLATTDPTIAAASTLILAVTTTLLTIAFFMGRSRRRSSGLDF